MDLASITPSVILFAKRLEALYATIQPIAPGASFASTDAATNTVVVAYPASTTQAQRNQVATVIAGFDWTVAGQIAWEDVQQPDFAALRNQAANAVQSNNTYLLTADTATNLDVRAQVKALTQQTNQLIKTLGAVIVRLTGR